MSSTLVRLRPWLEPTVGAVFFALWCVAEAGRYQGGSAVVALAAIAAAMALSRVRPIVALALVASVALLQVVDVLQPPESTTWPVLLGVLFVIFVVGWEAPMPVAFSGLALGGPLSLAVGYLLGIEMNRWADNTAARDLATFTSVAAISVGLYAGAWAIGYVLRVNLRELRALLLLRATRAQLGAAEVELAVTRERDRLSRDVHDVLAHSLAVVIAQADGARFIGAAKPEKTDVALRAIADAARSALIDVRTLIEGMREEDGDRPQPGLVDLEPLLAQLGQAGMAIESKQFGEAKEMTPAQQLAVFRILQESLTNALRHSERSGATRLSLDWRGPGLAVTVTSTGVEDAGTDDASTQRMRAGHGIGGMTDRARLAGGWLTAGASIPENQFVVTAFIPTGGSPS